MFKKTKFLKIFSLSLLFCLCFLAGRGAAALSDHASSARLTSGRITQAAENWGLSFQEEGAPPVGNATCEELETYDAYYREDTEEKVLYLTFDCGYENGNTPRILEAMKKHRAPATFFVVGNYLDTSPDLVRQMIREGHAVGNHTFHHPDMSQISGKEAFAVRKFIETGKQAFSISAANGDPVAAEDQENGSFFLFSGFIKDSRYPLAFIVVVEEGGYGSQTAAPIAGQVLNACIEDMDRAKE